MYGKRVGFAGLFLKESQSLGGGTASAGFKALLKALKPLGLKKTRGSDTEVHFDATKEKIEGLKKILDRRGYKGSYDKDHIELYTNDGYGFVGELRGSTWKLEAYDNTEE